MVDFYHLKMNKQHTTMHIQQLYGRKKAEEKTKMKSI